MTSVLSRLEALGLALPKLSSPAYSYEPFTMHNGVLYISGQISRSASGDILSGCIGAGATVSEGIAAAEIAALNLLARIEEAVGLDQVTKILKLNVWVNSAADFHDQPSVAEGASQLLADVFGPQGIGRHARTALPAHTLPKNALVELDAVVAFDS